MSDNPPFIDPNSILVSGAHPARSDEFSLLRECTFTTGRVSGPGGQHRNRVETAVFITHTPTGVATQGTERRSQIENRAAAIKRLRLCLAVQVRARPALPIAASALWCTRRRDRRLVIAAEHSDYPALLAEALDLVTSMRFDVAGAAALLDISTSQLVRLIRMNKAAGAIFTAGRKSAGLRPLSD
ncbi:MAG: peptide chain release factor-like protein [Phycisphaerales bacterium]|nr:peptide chain release factor-like protein [Phycisphaerales bacterium]